MPFWSAAAGEIGPLSCSLVPSGTMVDVDEERVKLFANGAKCVSLSSGSGQ